MSRHEYRARDFMEHMLEAATRIQKYVHHKTAEDFLADELVQDAVMRNIEVIGEAAKNVLTSLPEAATRFPQIPFAAIYGMRNRVSHGYIAVDMDIVWRVAVDEIDILLKLLPEAIATLPGDEGKTLSFDL